jgi:hypothetical protein
MRAPSPSMIVALLALFVALGGVGVAATGDNFILGQANSADQTTGLGVSTLPSSSTCPSPCPALKVADSSTAANAGGLLVSTKGAGAPAAQIVNNGSGPAVRMFVNGGAPFTVNSATKVGNLNADKLDGLDSTGFLRSNSPFSITGSTGGSGVITATNTGTANGMQGETGAAAASGVYGQNDGGGYGLAGRSNASNGIGVYAEALNGTPLVLHSNGLSPPMSVDSTVKVDNLNADKLDGLDSTDLVSSGRILANRLTAANVGDILLSIPGWGNLTVYKCDGNTAQLRFNTAGTGPVDFMYSGFAPNGLGYAPGEAYAVITNDWLVPSSSADFGPTVWGGYTLNIARDTGPGTKMVTIWVSWYAVGCRFQAQALESP